MNHLLRFTQIAWRWPRVSFAYLTPLFSNSINVLCISTQACMPINIASSLLKIVTERETVKLRKFKEINIINGVCTITKRYNTFTFVWYMVFPSALQLHCKRTYQKSVRKVNFIHSWRSCTQRSIFDFI